MPNMFLLEDVKVKEHVHTPTQETFMQPYGKPIYYKNDFKIMENIIPLPVQLLKSLNAGTFFIGLPGLRLSLNIRFLLV